MSVELPSSEHQDCATATFDLLMLSTRMFGIVDSKESKRVASTSWAPARMIVRVATGMSSTKATISTPPDQADGLNPQRAFASFCEPFVSSV